MVRGESNTLRQSAAARRAAFRSITRPTTPSATTPLSSSTKRPFSATLPVRNALFSLLATHKIGALDEMFNSMFTDPFALLSFSAAGMANGTGSGYFSGIPTFFEFVVCSYICCSWRRGRPEPQPPRGLLLLRVQLRDARRRERDDVRLQGHAVLLHGSHLHPDGRRQDHRVVHGRVLLYVRSPGPKYWPDGLLHRAYVDIIVLCDAKRWLEEELGDFLGKVAAVCYAGECTAEKRPVVEVLFVFICNYLSNDRCSNRSILLRSSSPSPPPSFFPPRSLSVRQLFSIFYI